MSRLADEVIANLFVTLGVRNDSHGDPLPLLYDQLFKTILRPDNEDALPRGAKRDKHDDVDAFEDVLTEIKKNKRLKDGLNSVRDEFRHSLFAKAVSLDCLEITEVLIHEGCVNSEEAEEYCESDAMLALLTEAGLMTYVPEEHYPHQQG